jgi:transcriptional regulator with XRE-family HTH domain
VSDQDRRKLVGAILREYRIAANVRQVDLANRLGQPQSFVSKYESGERALDVLEVRDACLALGVTLHNFVDRLDRELGSEG